MVMIRYQGRTALITGASSGIGEEFARQLAGRGMHLILVARSENKLRALADELAQRHSVRVEVIAADLSAAGAATQVYATTRERGLDVDLLVNNAGFGSYGPFETLDLAREQEQIRLNVQAVVELSHAVLPAMVARRAGAILNVASTAGLQPLPYMAVYGATKAFVLSFSEALWGQYRGQGVRVTALCPGPVATPFFDVVGAQEPQVGQMMQPADVVAIGLRGLERDLPSVVAGWSNFLLSGIVPRLVPRWAVVRVGERLLRPRNAAALAQR
jgi:uncharacterized protein